MATNIDIYNKARSYLGETGVPTQKWYGISGAWCNAWICRVFAEAGAKNLFYDGKKVAYCPTSIKWCEANLAQIPIYLLMPGDIMYFDWEPNGVPNHIGLGRCRISSSVAGTIEGNAGSPARVRELQRPSKYICGVFRPHYKPSTMPTKKKLAIDGQFDYSSIYMLQFALGLKADGILSKDTIKALQKKTGTNADGAWGTKTSKAVQKMTGATVDGEFGINSVKALQIWINNHVEFGTSIPSPTETSEVVAPEALKKLCIDTSYWQGKVSLANWKKVGKTCGYAIHRASYTSQDKFTLNKDSTFDNNFKNAQTAGLKCGAYHYSQAVSVSEAKKEAEYLCGILKNYNVDFYVVCDYEFGKRLNSGIGTKASDIANAFCDVVKSYGYMPMIYGNLTMMNSYLKNPKYPVWLAQYNDKCSYKGDYVLWQYTSSGKVEGIEGRVDLSKVYDVEDIKPATESPKKSTYPGELPSIHVKKTTQEAINDALKWGKVIVNDNDYHYGEYGRPSHKGTRIHTITHSNGCHFCKTNYRKKVAPAIKAGYKGENWEKTYVCNPFVNACYAHGAMESTCLNMCRKGTSAGMNASGRSGALDKSDNWKYLGKLPIKELKAGDVLVSEPHMQMVYKPVSNTQVQICEASSYNGKYHSKASDSSIRIKTKKPSYTSVYRFIGIVDADIPIRAGEVSNRALLVQKFLNWYGDYKLVEDGIAFDKTEAAIIDFQKREGLVADGEFGSKSLKKAKEIRK